MERLPQLYRVCNFCRGIKRLENRAPEWQAYFINHDEGAGDMPKPTGAGPELFDCGECDGRGIHLTEAGEQVADLLERLGVVTNDRLNEAAKRLTAAAVAHGR